VETVVADEEVAVAVVIVVIAATAVETEATARIVEIVPNAATEATLVAEDVVIVDVDVLTSEAATVVVVAVEDVVATLQTSPTRALSRVSAHDRSFGQHPRAPDARSLIR
jgi:hypothetical protein